MQSLKVWILTVAFSLLILPGISRAGNSTSTTAAELVQDEKVIYTLPEAGQVIPTHPLFIIKQIRDSIENVLTRDPVQKIKLKLRQADLHIVYAQTLASQNKPSAAIQAVEDAIDQDQDASKILAEMKPQSISEDEEAAKNDMKDIRFNLVQSNIKHAEVLRSLLTTLPKGEQESVLSSLEKLTSIRKDLNAL
ncbi:MAG: DUF5667 domain-containing protein [bacterium]